jgi:hypothetical protein
VNGPSASGVRKKIIVGLVGCLALSAGRVAAAADEKRLDVQDVSFLWPFPTTAADVDALITAADPTEQGGSTMLPKDWFDALMETAPKTSVNKEVDFTIKFGDFDAEFKKHATWKVAGIRIDPSAPGAGQKILDIFGSAPQIRLILQPVTKGTDGKPIVHDFAVHVVYAYIKADAPQPAAGGAQRRIPDKEAFGAVVRDLLAIKAELAAAGVETAGPLGVHPGLKRNAADFSKKLKQFLAKHLHPQRLVATAFMGLDVKEPWIFFAFVKLPNGKFLKPTFPTIAGKDAQMVNFRPGSEGSNVVPVPKTANLEQNRGVSTARLFDADMPTKLDKPVFDDLAAPLWREVPDIIAHPEFAHFNNTDCISCHTESTRRTILGVTSTTGQFRYQPPAGISGVDPAVLPKGRWNVRNFGWFPPQSTVTMRTANEAAESAYYINREYIAYQPPGTPPTKPELPGTPPNKPVLPPPATGPDVPIVEGPGKPRDPPVTDPGRKPGCCCVQNTVASTRCRPRLLQRFGLGRFRFLRR